MPAQTTRYVVHLTAAEARAKEEEKAKRDAKATQIGCVIVAAALALAYWYIALPVAGGLLLAAIIGRLIVKRRKDRHAAVPTPPARSVAAARDDGRCPNCLAPVRPGVPCAWCRVVSSPSDPRRSA